MKKTLRIVTLLTLLSSVTFYSRANVIAVTEAIPVEICNGANDGSIGITPSGGIAPYSYHWSNGSTTQNLNGVAAGTYTVTITDNTGTTGAFSFSVTQYSAILIGKSIVNENCGGQNIGSVTLSVSGGNPGYSFEWSNGATTENLSSLTAQEYFVTVTDAKGCTTIDSANVTQPIGIAIAMSVTDVSCSSGVNNGAITTTVQYGVSPYQYLWSDGATTQNVTGLATGKYVLTVTDAIGCSNADSAIVSLLPNNIDINTNPVSPLCSTSSGSVSITSVTGSTSPYTFEWSNGATTQNISGLGAGAYTVTVTSSAGCTAWVSDTLTQTGGANVTFHIFSPTCFGGNNGAVNTTTSGGTSPYSYSWSNGRSTADISGLGGGNYVLTVTDFTGCAVTATADVTQPAQLIVTTTSSPLSCSGGSTASVFTDVSGGTASYSYWWGAGVVTADRHNVGAGNYNVTVTDANGCTATTSATIEPYTPMSLFSTQTNVICYGNDNGTIDISVNNGSEPYTFAWNNGDGSADISSLVAGTYVVTVTDANLCTITKTCSINQPPFPTTVNSTVVDVSCYGLQNGSLTLNPINGAPPYNYKWGDGATTAGITNLAVGNYVVTITDSSGCRTSEVYTVTQPGLITPVAAVINDSCFGNNTGSITLSVTGGYAPFSYAWSNGVDSQQIRGLYAGSYTVTVTDNHSCSVTSSATVSQPSQLTLGTSLVNASCTGGSNGSVMVTASGGTPGYTYKWPGGVTTPTMTGAPPGNYTVTVTDDMGCTGHSTATVTSWPAIDITSTATNVACNGGNNGVITLSISGGAVPYTYNWGGGITTENRSNLASGNYTVTVTDSAGCTATSTASVTESTTMAVGASVINVSCFGMNNGFVTLVTSGGSAPYSYNWSNGNTTNHLNDVGSGTYIVTVTDHSGCSTSFTSAVTEPALLSVSSTSTPATCFGAANGAINITATGSTAPYTYNWGSGVTTQNRSNVAEGNYTVIVTDSAGCSVVNTSAVGGPAQISISPTVVNPLCNGNMNGSIQLAVSGGAGGFNFNWGGGVTTQNRTGLAAGSYPVTVTDAHACTASDVVTILQPAVITVNASATNVACFGSSTGSVLLTVSGGTTNYSYSWSTGSSNSNLINSPIGNYAVTVTDAHACTASASAVITQPTQLSTSVLSADNVTCYGMSNGGMDILNSGGTAPYSYNWSNGATTQNLTGVIEGHYAVSVADANGCTSSANINITQPNPITLDSVVTDLKCYGNNGGAISAVIIGGNGGYTYHWNNGATTASLSNIPAGTYTLSVDDIQNCSAAFTMLVTQPSQLALTPSQTNVTCNGGNTGSASVQVTGGTGAYTYGWGGGQTTSQLTHLAEGNYNITVSDANACSVTSAFDIIQINSIILNLTPVNVACFGQSTGSVNTTVSGGAGGYSYNWSDGATTADISAVISGSYNVTVTDANHCNTSASATVTQQSAITVTPNVTNVLCFGSSTGSIQLSSSGGAGGYQYLWSNGSSSQNLTNLATGNYTVTVKDANACTVTGAIPVSQPSQINISFNTANVMCNGGSNGAITTLATGGTGTLVYSWSNNLTTANISNLQAGNYTLTVKDAANCTVSSVADITQPVALTVNPTPVNVACAAGNTGSITTLVTGGTAGYTYNWSNQSTAQQLTQLTAGTYALTVHDANSCSATTSVTITQPAPIGLSLSPTGYDCADQPGAIQLFVTGGTAPYLYNWQDGNSSQNRTGLLAGNYTVTVTDNNSCTQTASATITHAPSLTASLASTNVSCFGGDNGSVGVVVSGGVHPYHYSWSNNAGAAQIQNLQAGAYGVLVTDVNGCSITADTAISQPPAIQISPVITAVSCYGQSNGNISVTASGGTASYSYLWNNNSTAQSISNISAGSYQLTVTDANNCTVAFTGITVTQPAQLAVTDTVVPVGCSSQNNGWVKVNVIGGTPPYSYNWSNGDKDATLDSLAPGSYTVTIDDNRSCNATKTVVITAFSPIALSITSENASCIGDANGSIAVTVSGGSLPYTYDWTNGQHVADMSDLPAGVYDVTVSDANGCSAQIADSVSTNYELTVHAETSSPVSNGSEVQLTATTNMNHNNVYSWSPADILTCPACQTTAAAPQQATVFTVTVVDANGCKATDTVSIEVNSGTNIFIPNVFTPNGDGVNDQFKMFGDLSNVYYMEIAIFDRWGEKVYESNDPNFEWDGLYKGEPAPIGVYVYVANLVFANGTKQELKGSLTLLK